MNYLNLLKFASQEIEITMENSIEKNPKFPTIFMWNQSNNKIDTGDVAIDVAADFTFLWNGETVALADVRYVLTNVVLTNDADVLVDLISNKCQSNVSGTIKHYLYIFDNTTKHTCV